MNIGLAILTIRIKKNLTQKAFAEITGLNRWTVLHLESGKKKPHKSTINKIATSFGLPLEFVVFIATEESDIPDSGKAHYNKIERQLKQLIRESL